jgi:probable phosphoglycerate mutase
MNKVTLIRHGETEWSLAGKHTGRSDIPLTPQGEANATRLKTRLAGGSPVLVLSSPLQRARRTCELAGFVDRMQIDDDLAEWDYGEYEGRTTADIHKECPDWSLFRDGSPGGETAADVGRRVDRVIARVRAATGDAMLFAHGHLLRVLAARWLGLPPESGALLIYAPAAVSILSYEHNLTEPAIALWNA